MVPAADGQGYWQASSAGELQAFGSALDFGGVPGTLARPVVGMTAMPAGATGVPTTNPTGPGTTDTTGPSTTTTTLLPSGSPQPFSSSAVLSSWRTPDDAARPGYAQLVTAVAQYGNRVFIGGEFTNLLDPNKVAANPPIQYLAELDASTGAPIPGSTWTANAQPDKIVKALAVSPDGKRLYVGGDFNNIGGQRIDRLAALDINTGKVDPTFNPPAPSAHVNAILPANGRVYIGGAWKTLGGAPIPELASLMENGSLDTAFVTPQDFGGRYETHTGKAVEDPCLNVAPPCDPSGVVQGLAATADGSTLMAGGNFLHFGKALGDPAWDYKNHGGLVALDAHSGALTTWQPLSSRPAFGMVTWPGDGKTIFVANGGGGGGIFKYVPGGVTKAVWKATVDGDATAVAATATRVYLAGHYDHVCQDQRLQGNTNGGFSCVVNGPIHRHVAAFDPNGVLDSGFDAQENTPEGPDAIAVGPHALYVGGNFTGVADRAGTPPRDQNGFALYPHL
jgi:hypothetical protein